MSGKQQSSIACVKCELGQSLSELFLLGEVPSKSVPLNRDFSHCSCSEDDSSWD